MWACVSTIGITTSPLINCLSPVEAVFVRKIQIKVYALNGNQCLIDKWKTLYPFSVIWSSWLTIRQPLVPTRRATSTNLPNHFGQKHTASNLKPNRNASQARTRKLQKKSELILQHGCQVSNFGIFFSTKPSVLLLLLRLGPLRPKSRHDENQPPSVFFNSLNTTHTSTGQPLYLSLVKMR